MAVGGALTGPGEGGSSREVEVVTHFLEMTAPDQLRPGSASPHRLRFVEAVDPPPELAWFLYVAVGGRWDWVDRLGWGLEAWREHVARREVALWVAYLDGSPAGYVEFRLDLPGAVQIWYFGLLPAYVGRGLGGELLTRAVRTAWAWEPGRVWLHTCSLDAPAALENYRARGFRIYDETRVRKRLPARSPVCWPE